MAKEIKIPMRVTSTAVLDVPAIAIIPEGQEHPKDRFQINLQTIADGKSPGNNITLNVDSLQGFAPGQVGELTFTPTAETK